MLTLPMDLSQSLIERGFNRVDIVLTDEGLLVRPYSGERRVAKVELTF